MLEIETKPSAPKQPGPKPVVVPIHHVNTLDVNPVMLELLGDTNLVQLLMSIDLSQCETTDDLKEIVGTENLTALSSAINCNLLDVQLKPHPYLVAQYQYLTEKSR